VTTTHKRRSSPLIYPAVFLSLASLAWTTWSLVDLLGTGWIGFTVAAGSDIVWGSVIIAEARGLRIAGRTWVVPALGWGTLVIVAVFLASHGIVRDSIAMAAAGPFLPFGAKVVWALALADMRGPAALTHDELHKLARMERGMVFEEAEHDIQMRQQRMRAELLMSEVTTDFDIEVMRQDRVRDLRRRAPLALTASTQPDTMDKTPDTRPDTSGQPDSDQDTAQDKPPVISQDTRPDTPDVLKRIASAASGPADLVRTLCAHGVPQPSLVSEAIRLRPDMNPDSIRRTAKRLGEGPYL
jgi:hypothetical protein